MCHVTVARSLIQENVIHSKNEVSVDVIVKKTKHGLCKNNYAQNPSVCACECDEYLKNCTCIKGPNDSIEVTSDGIVNM